MAPFRIVVAKRRNPPAERPRNTLFLAGWRCKRLTYNGWKCEDALFVRFSALSPFQIKYENRKSSVLPPLSPIQTVLDNTQNAHIVALSPGGLAPSRLRQNENKTTTLERCYVKVLLTESKNNVVKILVVTVEHQISITRSWTISKCNSMCHIPSLSVNSDLFHIVIVFGSSLLSVIDPCLEKKASVKVFVYRLA